ncbi:hypothetical protein G5B10_00800 [Fluviicola sp. SGL-29]|nr:hypothetical protein [Fluviicola sp. SGL-29]
MKKLETLFHSTDKLRFLKAIIQHGFSPSYSKEKIGERDVLIAMVSFSNIPLIEARTQVDYGKYSIGLKREWGISNNLHPVTYTYKESEQEMMLTKLIEDFALFQAMPELVGVKANFNIFFDGFRESFAQLYDSALKTGNAETIQKYFADIFVPITDLQLFFKHYIDKNKRGKTVYCFNDREWRFIPNIEKKMFFASNPSGDREFPEYKEILNTPKPHVKNVKLNFSLGDIEFIMVKKNNEIKGVVQTLKKRFGKDEVMSAILNGELLVFSFEKLYNSI